MPSIPAAETAAATDHKEQRTADVEKIKNSNHPRKVVVAGPGTGKSYLFTELLKKKRDEGKTNFLAITFIGKLGDALADDLCGLAPTTTMHGFARALVLKHWKGCSYYPQMKRIIEGDLLAEGITEYAIGDENYRNKTLHYFAIGDDDVIHYASEICRKDERKIPRFDLLLIDEYQDFNEAESALIDLLAQKNQIAIVGDDDQALYVFKGSSPSFIRAKYHPDNTDFESHTLRYCSRCTEVVIRYFHSLVRTFNLNDPKKGRIQKEYECYLPEKAEDSKANPKIHMLMQCPSGMIASKIESELEAITKAQKIQDVLVIGEAQSCGALLKQIYALLKNRGFKSVDHRGAPEHLPIQQDVVDAYRLLAKDSSSLLAWRLLGSSEDENVKKQHSKNAQTLDVIINGTPSERNALTSKRIVALENAIENWPNGGERERTEVRSEQNEGIRKTVLTEQLKRTNLYLRRPLGNLDITVCNILNSKGLGADVVFLVGFDQGRFPLKGSPTESEIYQMLVAITRAKKRIYLINSVGKAVSSFVQCLEANDLVIEDCSNQLVRAPRLSQTPA
jgi:superfamily I DNA/RNA helicase